MKIQIATIIVKNAMVSTVIAAVGTVLIHEAFRLFIGK